MAVSDSPAATAGQTNGQRSVSHRTVNITGRGADVAFVIDENAPMEVVARDLSAHLSGRGALFSEGGVSVHTGERVFSSWEKAAVQRIFEDNSGLRVSRFISSSGDYETETEDGVNRPPHKTSRRRFVPQSPAQVSTAGSGLTGYTRGNHRNRSHAMIITSTFRSGETIRHYGDVVVLGDVNPGSEITADGDIVVMGSLKGLVHAGATGDNRAAVIALEMASPRIRIGDCEAVVQQGNGRKPRRGDRAKELDFARPTIAYTRRGDIFISPFAGRFARYTKGVPYDG